MKPEETENPPISRKLGLSFIGLCIGVVGSGIVAFVVVDNATVGVLPTEKTLANSPMHAESKNDEVFRGFSNLEELQSLVNHKSSFERAMYLQGVFAAAGQKELDRIFAETATIEPVNLRCEVQDAIIHRLAQIDPEKAVQHLEALPEVRRQQLIGIVFQAWSIADLEQSQAFAKDMLEPGRTAALQGILRSRIDLSDAARREIAVRLGNEQFLLDQMAANRGLDSIDKPEGAFSEFIAVHGKDVKNLSSNQRTLLVSIASAWIDSGGFGETVQRMSTFLADYDDNVALIELLLVEVVTADPRIVMGASTGMGPELRSIVVNAVSNLAKMDPEVALEIASMMESEGSQVVFRRAAISGWMETDPKAVLDARNRMPKVFENWIEQSSLMSLIRLMPEEVPPYIHQIKDEGNKDVVVSNLSYSWARKDPMAVFDWLQSVPEVERWYGNIMGDIIENLTIKNPEEAMRFALEQPRREYDGVGWEVSVVSSVADSDIDAAIALSDQARDEKTRAQMMRSIGQVLINQAQFERAMEWADNLKAEQVEEYHDRVVVSWAWGNPEQLYEQMENLPSDKLRALAAEWLILANESQKALTKAQIEELQEVVPQESSPDP